MPRPGHLLTLAVAAAAVYLYALTSDNALLGLLVKSPSQRELARPLS